MNAVDLATSRKFWGNGAAQTRVLARNGDNAVTYIAVGTRGSATSDPAWTVEKLTYDTNGLYSYSTHSPDNSIADNFLTLEYA